MLKADRTALSVVIATPTTAPCALAPVVRSLFALVGKEQLELLIIVPSAATLGFRGDELQGFWGVKVLEVGPFNSWSQAMAIGVQAATAEWVVMGEDHSYVGPGWAQAMIEAQRGPWAAVGPSIDNANPRTGLSWANLVLNYGLWLAGASRITCGGGCADLPGHNTSYRRESLLALGDEKLREVLPYNQLHAALRERGLTLHFAPSARVYHLNPSLWWVSIKVRFVMGRHFGGSRARTGKWSVGRRLLYIVASPLIPVMGLRSVLNDLRQAGRRDIGGARFWCAMGALLVVAAAGELFGYVIGPGNTSKSHADAEFKRHEELCKSDKVNEGAMYSGGLTSGDA